MGSIIPINTKGIYLRSDDVITGNVIESTDENVVVVTVSGMQSDTFRDRNSALTWRRLR